ncbi:LOW QUALITY PROTEIN: hypothetical protein HID58_033127, partial [Brassica napus]
FTFRSLVKLRLLSVIYSDDESFSSLISTCPVLEDCGDASPDNVVTFTVDLPSLKSLSVASFGNCYIVSFLLISCIQARYPRGTVLFQLVRLELCSCDDSWTSMLVSLLHHSPKLQALKLVQDHGMPAERKVRWIQPRFEWRDYEGTKVEKEVAIYILNNAKRLVRKHKMFEEVEIATRSLRACELTVG